MIDIQVEIRKTGRRRYVGCVDLNMEALTGYEDDFFGAKAEGSTPGEAIEEATAKVIALVQSNPEIASILIPVAGPQLTALLLAARYLDAPDVIMKIAREARADVRSVARKLRAAARKAKRYGVGVAKIGKSLVKKLKFW